MADENKVAGLIEAECDAVKAMLLEKNRAYGNSALEPVRVFSKAPVDEQIRVRLDDKLSRLARGSAAGEDVEADIIGYLVLMRVHRRLAEIPLEGGVQVSAEPVLDTAQEALSEAWNKARAVFGPINVLGDEVPKDLTQACEDFLRSYERLDNLPSAPGPTLSKQVRDFQAMIGRPAPEAPCVPDAETMRLRLCLILEEAFETLRAAIPGRWELAERVMQQVKEARAELFKVDFPAFIDGLADLDFVVEGTRQECGVDGGPIAREVYRANMRKLGGPKSPEGKHLKPPGWVGPDIVGALKGQGWRVMPGAGALSISGEETP